MRTSKPTLALLAALAALGGLVNLSHAQSVTTAPVGAMTVQTPVGLTPIGIALTNADLISTTASSASAGTVTLSGVSNAGALLQAGEPYYLEVYSGELKGDRFDIDTAATIANASAVVSLTNANNENTFDLNAVGALLNGAAVKIRKHITVEQIQASFATSLVGNNSATSADQILIFDSTTSSYTTYFLRADGVTWRKLGTTTSVNKSPIHPGKGIFFQKQSQAATATILGQVRTNDFVRKYDAGFQLLSTPWPVDFSPQNTQATSSNGWVGNNSATSADQILVYNTGTASFDTYFLRGDGTTWRKLGTTTTVTTDSLMSAQSSFFIKRASADSGFLIVNSLSL